MADPLSAHHRRLDVLRPGLSSYVPRPLLRVLQSAARAVVDSRGGYPRGHDGHGVLRLYPALGPDELLGRNRHHKFALSYPRDRNLVGAVAARWLLGWRCDLA